MARAGATLAYALPRGPLATPWESPAAPRGPHVRLVFCFLACLFASSGPLLSEAAWPRARTPCSRLVNCSSKGMSCRKKRACDGQRPGYEFASPPPSSSSFLQDERLPCVKGWPPRSNTFPGRSPSLRTRKDVTGCSRSNLVAKGLHFRPFPCWPGFHRPQCAAAVPPSLRPLVPYLVVVITGQQNEQCQWQGDVRSLGDVLLRELPLRTRALLDLTVLPWVLHCGHGSHPWYCTVATVLTTRCGLIL